MTDTSKDPIEAALAAHAAAAAALEQVPREQIVAKLDAMISDPAFVAVINCVDKLLPHLPTGMLQQSLANMVMSTNNSSLQLKQATGAAVAAPAS